MGVCLGGGLSLSRGLCPTPLPPVNRQTGVKTLPSIAVGKNSMSFVSGVSKFYNSPRVLHSVPMV